MAIVTGATSSTVVTLSRNADRTAVISASQKSIQAGLPFETWVVRIATYSKTPECRVIPTITVIPRSRAMVSKSTPRSASSWVRMPSTIIRLAPSRATMARLFFSTATVT